MTPQLITVVLTVLAAVVIVLTRVRLVQNEGAGRISIPQTLLNAHTGTGVLALVLWVTYLFILGNAVIGVLAILCWWITAGVGLLILARWLPAKGRHSSGPKADTWGEGPGLSILGHIGMVVGALVWTSLFILGKI